MLFFVLLCCGVIVMVWTLGDKPVSEEIELIIALTVIFVFIGLFMLWNFIVMWTSVTIDEKGVHRSFWGRFRKRTIQWEEIQDIRQIVTIKGVSMWVFFSKTNLEGKGLTKCRMRRDNIWLMYSEELQKTVKHYSGKEISKKH